MNRPGVSWITWVCSKLYGKLNYKRSSYLYAVVVGLPEERVRRVMWKAVDKAQTDPVEISQAEIDRMGSDRVKIDQAGTSLAPTFHEDATTEPNWLDPF